MTLFVDASALVAIVQGEAEATELAERLQTDEARLTSALALWEAARAIQRDRESTADSTMEELTRFLDGLGIAVAPIGSAEALHALRAHERYGKGQHAAKLNMGDCFAYACARTNGARLVYKGDDFARTDLA